MQREGEGGAIRLTNKTALALRRYAKQERTLAMCAAVILTLAMAALAVLLGLRWLVAVPVITALAVLLDAAIFIHSRTRYLSLTAQAICAEAAARQLRSQKKEKDRRAQALEDFAGVKEDALRAARETPQQQSAPGDEPPYGAPPVRAEMKNAEEENPPAPQEEEDGALPEHLPPRRRRRQATLTVLRKEDAK